ncbi:MAG: UDP-2,3-diacylglucosamine diphosphatase [Betaproteobacteria bacterium]|nr:UDP-2,3-diacylglucosamine diphosphatase [Betaproteobacteria bacterium]
MSQTEGSAISDATQPGPSSANVIALHGADGTPISCCLFISDLHLCASRPAITHTFLKFLSHEARHVDAIFILGDLFEYWAGDDDIEDEFHKSIIQAFQTLSQNNTKIFFMHGNRDFLITDTFCDKAKITLLQDPTLIEVHQTKILLSHGDTLCTDDTDYQTFRKQVRNQQWQSEFLNLPLAVRKQHIAAIRRRSESDKSKKSSQIMDVNAEAIHLLLKAYDHPALLIHGHTHRPAQHTMILDGHQTTRWVLGDWYEQGSYLSLSKTGLESKSL